MITARYGLFNRSETNAGNLKLYIILVVAGAFIFNIQLHAMQSHGDISAYTSLPLFQVGARYLP
jgi:hypothetical protein